MIDFKNPSALETSVSPTTNAVALSILFLFNMFLFLP